MEMEKTDSPVACLVPDRDGRGVTEISAQGDPATILAVSDLSIWLARLRLYHRLSRKDVAVQVLLGYLAFLVLVFIPTGILPELGIYHLGDLLPDSRNGKFWVVLAFAATMILSGSFASRLLSWRTEAHEIREKIYSDLIVNLWVRVSRFDAGSAYTTDTILKGMRGFLPDGVVFPQNSEFYELASPTERKFVRELFESRDRFRPLPICWLRMQIAYQQIEDTALLLVPETGRVWRKGLRFRRFLARTCGLSQWEFVRGMENSCLDILGMENEECFHRHEERTRKILQMLRKPYEEEESEPQIGNSPKPPPC